MNPFARIRFEERRDTWAAFAVLFGLIASHTVLETARDALFLASIPAARLPWVYVGIAVVSLGIAQLQLSLTARISGRSAVGLWTMAAGAVTLAFWHFLPVFGASGLYAIYIWSGALTALVLVHYWALLADLFTVSQARRLYGIIGAASSMGAIAGSAVAGLLARELAARDLVLVAALGLVATSILPAMLRTPAPRDTDDADAAPAGLGTGLTMLLRHPYARRVAALLLVAAACVTLGDFLFKAMVAAAVPAERLAVYFATVALVLNVLSLVVQLVGVGWIVDRVGVTAALAVLPVLLLGAGTVLALTAALAPVLVIKATDGGLRHSLHRTASELLFVPMADAVRRPVRALLDIAGQRGGQVLAAVAILGAAAAGLPPRALIGLFLVLAVVWIVLAITLRRHYLDLFRRRLDRGQQARIAAFPELDVGSLEVLVEALDSPDPNAVIAAMEILEREGRARLVPGFIVGHPDEAVVVRALHLLAADGRTQALPAIDQLAGHASPRVRAEAVVARATLGYDEELLRKRLADDPAPEVQAAILVHLLASGAIVGSDARTHLDGLVAGASVAARIQLAEAIGRRRADGFEDVLETLSRAPQREVQLAAIAAMRRSGSRAHLRRLVELIATEGTRVAARDALLDHGRAALDVLTAVLADHGVPQALRWQVPRCIAAFENQRAADVLLASLPDEWDGMQRYQVIRALEGLVRRQPTLRLDRTTLDLAIVGTVARAYRYLDRRLSLERGAAAAPARRTPGHALLAQMLDDKRAHSVDRLLRLLALRHPRESFADIRVGLASPGVDRRASGLELLGNVLRQPLRDAAVALVDDIADEERLRAGSTFHEPLELDYDSLLESMLASQSQAVQDLTAYHIGELQLTRFVDQLGRLAGSAGPERLDVRRALDRLQSPEVRASS